MFVCQSLFVIFVQGFCYGYQLWYEFDCCIGLVWLFNVGQIYNILEWFECDGLVCCGVIDDYGYVYWEIILVGVDEVDCWFFFFVVCGQGIRDEFVIKFVVVVMLLGVDVFVVIWVQCVVLMFQLEQLWF